jgi:hypothetical protein
MALASGQYEMKCGGMTRPRRHGPPSCTGGNHEVGCKVDGKMDAGSFMPKACFLKKA